MSKPTRMTVNLDAADSPIDDVEDVDELVEASDCSNRSELIRELLAGTPLDQLVDTRE